MSSSGGNVRGLKNACKIVFSENSKVASAETLLSTTEALSPLAGNGFWAGALGRMIWRPDVEPGDRKGREAWKMPGMACGCNIKITPEQ